MSRIAVILFVSFTSLIAAAAGSCGKRVSAFNIYDQIVGGKLTDKFSIFPVADWSNDSSYEGFAVAKNDAAESLRIQGASAITTALVPWDLDKNYRAARVNMNKFAAEETEKKSKTFKVQLLKKGRVLCEDNYSILDSGD